MTAHAALEPVPVRRRPEPLRILDDGDAAYLLDGFATLLPHGDIEPHLRGVVDDALRHPGSLVRAQLAFDVLRRHDAAPDEARRVAIAIEYFHTASLIFDDLPAMDDADERRGRPCPHRRWGESAAMLGALAFINQGYALLWSVIGTVDPARGARAAELVGRCLGVDGIHNGQALDLHFDGPERGEGDVLRVAEGKTATLIRLTLLLPAILAGVDDRSLERLDRLAGVWGLSYQILDDFKDGLASRVETGKSTRRDGALGRPNLPLQVGPSCAMRTLTGLLAEARLILAHLAGDDDRWRQLATVQRHLESERLGTRRRLTRRA